MKESPKLALFLFTVFSLAFLPPAVEAKKEDAPGIQKKIPLTMSAPALDVSTQSVTIFWSTNKPSNSSISVTQVPLPFGGDPILMFDSSLITEHEMTVPYLTAGATHEYEVISSDPYGYTVRSRGTFTTPAL